MDGRLKVYFAGPDVFREKPEEYFKEIEKYSYNYGFTPLFPYDNTLYKSDSIYHSNRKLLHYCDIVVANLDKFRSPSLDPGVAFEIGYAKALGKPVIGYYTEDFLIDYKEKVTEDMLAISPQYPVVENFNLYDNLMIAHSCDFIERNLENTLALLKPMYFWLIQ